MGQKVGCEVGRARTDCNLQVTYRKRGAYHHRAALAPGPGLGEVGGEPVRTGDAVGQPLSLTTKVQDNMYELTLHLVS